VTERSGVTPGVCPCLGCSAVTPLSPRQTRSKPLAPYPPVLRVMTLKEAFAPDFAAARRSDQCLLGTGGLMDLPTALPGPVLRYL
jgi:hypothetical protein